MCFQVGGSLTLSLDFFEIAILLGACFIVNYVTADAKTNWIEGYAMVSFYVMIVSNILVFSLKQLDLLTLLSQRHCALGFILVSPKSC